MKDIRMHYVNKCSSEQQITSGSAGCQTKYRSISKYNSLQIEILNSSQYYSVLL